MHPDTEQTTGSPSPGPAPEARAEFPGSDEAARPASRGGPTPTPAIAPRQAESPPEVAKPGAAMQATLPLQKSPGSTPASGSESPAARREAVPARKESSEPADASLARAPRRFLLTARAQELTWMSVRADGGERRQVLLRAGEVAQFAADTGFVVTLGNAGGVGLTLNGAPVAFTGKSGEVIRDMALPSADAGPRLPGAAPPRESRPTAE